MYEYISSRQNPKILEAASLKDRKTREEKGLFFFEGKKLFNEAIERNVPLVRLFARSSSLPDSETLSRLPKDCEVYEVNDGVYEKITEEKSPEGLFCIAKTIDKFHKFATIYNKRENFCAGFAASAPRTLLMAVSLRDPGNLGTVIRTARAFDCGGLILSKDCADIYNSKTVRAAMGTLFDCPILIVDDAEKTVEALKDGGYAVYGSALDRNAVRLTELPNDEKCCMIVGNEGHGLPSSLLEKCSRTVFIPMTENAESLNASIAAAILMYSRFIQK